MERYRGNNGGECSLEEVSRSMIKCLSTGRRWRPPLLAALHEDTSFTRTRSSRRTVLAPVSTTVLPPLSFLTPPRLAEFLYGREKFGLSGYNFDSPLAPEESFARGCISRV